MSLKDKLLDDMKVAMREKDTVKKDVVQMIRACVLQVEKDKRITLEDEGVLEVITKEMKKRRDSMPEYEKSGRADLIEQLKREIDIIQDYLPSQLSIEELDDIVKQSVAKANAVTMKDIGKVMAVIMPLTKGRADGKVINELVKKYLS